MQINTNTVSILMGCEPLPEPDRLFYQQHECSRFRHAGRLTHGSKTLPQWPRETPVWNGGSSETAMCRIIKISVPASMYWLLSVRPEKLNRDPVQCWLYFKDLGKSVESWQGSTTSLSPYWQSTHLGYGHLGEGGVSDSFYDHFVTLFDHVWSCTWGKANWYLLYDDQIRFR